LQPGAASKLYGAGTASKLKGCNQAPHSSYGAVTACCIQLYIPPPNLVATLPRGEVHHAGRAAAQHLLQHQLRVELRHGVAVQVEKKKMNKFLTALKGWLKGWVVRRALANYA
jgi:hypothetical protein